MTERPFVDESYNGNKTLMTAEEVARTIDDSVGARVTVKLHDLGLIDDESFLRIIRPHSYNGQIRTLYKDEIL